MDELSYLHYIGKSTFDTDFEWSKKLYPLVKLTIGHLLIETACEFMDMQQATDLIVPTNHQAIGVRCRRPGILNNRKSHRSQWVFEIREGRPSKRKTELEKILVNKHCDVSFYGHVNENNTAFIVWWLINLDVFRQTMAINPALGERVLHRDGTSSVCFDIRKFPPEIILGGSFPHPSCNLERARLTVLAEAAAAAYKPRR